MQTIPFQSSSLGSLREDQAEVTTGPTPLPAELPGRVSSIPKPSGGGAEAAETQAMKGVCCSCVTRTQVSSQAPARQKPGKCPAGQEAAAGSVGDPLLPHSTGSLPLRKEQEGIIWVILDFRGFSP